jgi:Fuc2NAc and GlcNAc transferase
MDVVALVASFLVSVLLLAVLLRLAPRFELIAHPNARSSHRSATPTVGGIAIVIPIFVALAAGAIAAGIDGGVDAVNEPLLGSVVLLAAIGFLDDLRELGAGLRLCLQTIAVLLFLYGADLGLAGFWQAVIGLLLLWHINLYNFMDGIDGIAAIQTLFFCIGSLLLTGGVSGDTGLLIWTISGATLGFLAFNWPPARIFMGDVGSLVLGLIIGALVIELHRTGGQPFPASIILLTGFWFDASYTLCIRVFTGQPFARAHRSHLYQRLSDRIGHLGTTLLFALTGLVWLLPLAWLSVGHPAWSPACIAVATLPYLAGAVFLRAGQVIDG